METVNSSKRCRQCGWWRANWRHERTDTPSRDHHAFVDRPAELPHKAPLSIHRSSIHLVARRDNWQTRGFWRGVALASGCGKCGECDWCDTLEGQTGGFLPDLYRIERENAAEPTGDPKITIWIGELEDASPISAHKLATLINFWFVLDAYSADWQARLVVYDRYGENSREINLGDRWFAEMYRDARQA